MDAETVKAVDALWDRMKWPQSRKKTGYYEQVVGWACLTWLLDNKIFYECRKEEDGTYSASCWVRNDGDNMLEVKSAPTLLGALVTACHDHLDQQEQPEDDRSTQEQELEHGPP